MRIFAEAPSIWISIWRLGLAACLGIATGLGAGSASAANLSAQLDRCPAGCDPGRVCFEQSCVPAPMRCAPQCEQRAASGKCQQYAPDACGPAMLCAGQCLARQADGRCRQWAPDLCGPEMACVRRCETRAANGVCTRYAEDLCGPRASCSANCVDRDAKGKCRSYDADACASAD